MDQDVSGERGFTLVELLVVMIIIGILVAIAVPVFLNQQQQAHRTSAVSDLRNTAVELESIAADNAGVYSHTDGWTEVELGDARALSTNHWVSLEVTATDFTYCLLGSHALVPGEELSYRSTTREIEIGSPADITC